MTTPVGGPGPNDQITQAQTERQEPVPGENYTVQEGDTLRQILVRAGYSGDLLPFAIEAAVDGNANIPHKDMVYLGSTIEIPAELTVRTYKDPIQLDPVVVTAPAPPPLIRQIEVRPLEIPTPELRPIVPQYVCHPDVGKALDSGKDRDVRNIVLGPAHQPGVGGNDKLLGATSEQKAELLHILLRGSTTGRDEQAALRILEQAATVGDLDQVLLALNDLEREEGDQQVGKWLTKLISDINGGNRDTLYSFLTENVGEASMPFVLAAVVQGGGSSLESGNAIQALLRRSLAGGYYKDANAGMKEALGRPINARLEAFDDKVSEFPGEVFMDPETGMVVITKDHFINFGSEDQEYLDNSFFWGNVAGGRAHQMDSRGFGGTSVEYGASFEGGVRIERNGDAMTVTDADGDSINLVKVDAELAERIQGNLQNMPLPATQEPEYLASLPASDGWPEGSYLLVDSPKYDYSYEGFRAFVGPPGNMQEVEIETVRRRHDGGTTVIDTSLGQFYFPTPFNQEAASTFTPAGSEEPVEISKLPIGESADLIGTLGVDFGEDNLQVPDLPASDSPEQG